MSAFASDIMGYETYEKFEETTYEEYLQIGTFLKYFNGEIGEYDMNEEYRDVLEDILKDIENETDSIPGEDAYEDALNSYVKNIDERIRVYDLEDSMYVRRGRSDRDIFLEFSKVVSGRFYDAVKSGNLWSDKNYPVMELCPRLSECYLDDEGLCDMYNAGRTNREDYLL